MLQILLTKDKIKDIVNLRRNSEKSDSIAYSRKITHNFYQLKIIRIIKIIWLNNKKINNKISSILEKAKKTEP